MVEFSVIIPIYKVEKYLEKCVNSVLSQTFTDYEIILVDDGSPDNCGSICDKYADLKSNIKVIHKQNGGLSSARNAGIKVAQGKYILFLDSDDFWDDKEALFNINNNLNETDADLLIFPAKRYYEYENKYTYIVKHDVDRDQVINPDIYSAIEYLIKHNIYRAAAWNKVIKKTIIDDYNMEFKDGLLSEDMDWCGDLLLYAKRFDWYSEPLYAYRQQREGSITRKKNNKLVADKLYMCKKGYHQAQEIDDLKKGKLLAGYYAYEYSVMLGVSSSVTEKNLLEEIKKMDVLLEYDISEKVQKVKTLRKIIGYRAMRWILCLFVRIKR